MTQTWPAADAFRGRDVLVTGGVGFMGLNLVTALLEVGAQVRILGRSWPPSSGMLADLLHEVRFVKGDIRDETAVDEAVEGCAFLFNLAGKAGPTASNAAPFEDLDVNGRGQLVILEACRRLAPQATVVFPSSRLVYAPTDRLPVDESAATGPLSVYGVHKLAAEQYHRIYARLYGLKTVILRITNPYGRFQRAEQNRYGIINWFIHLAVHDEALPVFGDGRQLRDYVHVQDVVRAFLLAGSSPKAVGKTLNVGGGHPVTFHRMAEMVVHAASRGHIKSVPWPAEAAKVETGDFSADIRAIDALLGWRPAIGLEEGITDVVRQYERADERFENWSAAISG